MLQNAYLLAKISADTAENERNFAEICQKLETTPRVDPEAARALKRGDHEHGLLNAKKVQAANFRNAGRCIFRRRRSAFFWLGGERSAFCVGLASPDSTANLSGHVPGSIDATTPNEQRFAFSICRSLHNFTTLKERSF